MSLLRPGVIKQHKTNQTNFYYVEVQAHIWVLWQFFLQFFMQLQQVWKLVFFDYKRGSHLHWASMVVIARKVGKLTLVFWTVHKLLSNVLSYCLWTNIVRFPISIVLRFKHRLEFYGNSFCYSSCNCNKLSHEFLHSQYCSNKNHMH